MKKKKRLSLALKIFVVLFSVYASVQLIRLKVKINAQQEEQNLLTEQRDELKTKNAELREIAESDQDEDYIASIARDQLDYVYSGEQVFKDISGK